MNSNPKLIIIRGPSASGKSTVAKTLFKKTQRPTLLVSEDTIRKFFNDQTKPGHLPSRELATKAVLTGLANGYDVIYHGILRINDGNEHRFDELLQAHPDENYFYYLDVSLEETIRRHENRRKKDQFSSEAMKKWWNLSSPTNFGTELIIKENSTADSTVDTIIKTAKLRQ